MAILPEFLCGRDCQGQCLRPCHPLSAAGTPLYNVNDTPVIPLHVVFSACPRSFLENSILSAVGCTIAAAAAWRDASSAPSPAPLPAPVTHILQRRGDPIGVSGSDQSEPHKPSPQKSWPHCRINAAFSALPSPARPGRQLRVPFAWSSPIHLDRCVPHGVYSGLQQRVQCREECSAFPLKENWGSKP